MQQSLRNQYVLSYTSSNKVHDGSYRKIKVELVDAKRQSHVVQGREGKATKYDLAKSGYKAPRQVE